MFLKNRNIIFKMKISKVTDYVALSLMSITERPKYKSTFEWSFIVVISCDSQTNCSNNAGNDRHVCMDYVSYICTKFYTCMNKTSVK